MSFNIQLFASGRFALVRFSHSFTWYTYYAVVNDFRDRPGSPLDPLFTFYSPAGPIILRLIFNTHFSFGKRNFESSIGTCGEEACGVGNEGATQGRRNTGKKGKREQGLGVWNRVWEWEAMPG